MRAWYRHSGSSYHNKICYHHHYKYNDDTVFDTNYGWEKALGLTLLKGGYYLRRNFDYTEIGESL